MRRTWQISTPRRQAKQKHSITLEHVNVDEERVEGAKQDVAMFFFGSCPEVHDGRQSRQVTMPSKQKQRCATFARWTPSTSTLFIKTVLDKIKFTTPIEFSIWRGLLHFATRECSGSCFLPQLWAGRRRVAEHLNVMSRSWWTLAMQLM